MFDNIGDKIMAVAIVSCIVGIIASVVLGLKTLGTSVGTGILIIVCGSLGSWLGSLCLYGFGQLIEDTSVTRQINAEILKRLKADNDPDNSRMEDAFKRAASVGSYRIPGSQAAGSDSWRCKKCKSINHRTQQYCGNCGEYR